MRTEISEKVMAVIKGLMEQRNETGNKEYGRTLDDVPYTDYDWNLMALEELADCVQYLMKENMRLRQDNVRLAKSELKKHTMYVKLHGEHEALKQRVIKHVKIFMNGKFGKVDTEMKFKDYQELSTRTMPKEGTINSIRTNYVLGLCGEAGEVADLIKKQVFHKHDVETKEIAKEIGDVLHYLSGVATLYDLSLEQCATMNLEKLRKRYPNGFNSEDSIKRVDMEMVSTDKLGIYPLTEEDLKIKIVPVDVKTQDLSSMYPLFKKGE